MQARLYRTALLFPLGAAAAVALLFVTRPAGHSCGDYQALTTAQHVYQVELRIVGGVIGLALIVLMWLLARHGRLLAQTTDSVRGKLLAITLACLGVALIAGTLRPVVIWPVLVIGLLSTAFLISPGASVIAYIATARSATHANERRFIRRALVLYSLLLLFVLPGVLTLLAAHVSPICLD